MTPSNKPPQTHNGGDHASSQELRQKLHELFKADRTLRERERSLLSTQDQATLVEVLCQAREEAKRQSDASETGLQLERLADLYAQVPAKETTEALLTLLDEEDPGVRVQAADALVDIASERYAQIVKCIDRRLEAQADGLAMRELPWVLVEIGESDTLALLERFLRQPAAEVVASAVEALVSIGLPDTVDLLQQLKDDPRPVDLEQLDGENEGSMSLGEFVREAIAELTE